MTEMNPWVRIFKNVQFADDGCWLWQGVQDGNGYSTFVDHGRRWGVHRWVMVQIHGEPGPGMHTDHLCRRILCINPDHLEFVTHRENIRRGRAGEKVASIQRDKTHCPSKHPYAGENLIIRQSDGARICRACEVARWKRTREKRRASRAS